MGFLHGEIYYRMNDKREKKAKNHEIGGYVDEIPNNSL